MPRRPTSDLLDYDTLAEDLKALGYPARLELLDRLRFPKTLGEIRLAPRRSQPGENPDRPAARATVLGHLEMLVEAGLVKEEEAEVDGRRTSRYVVNPLKLYGVVEELRRLSVMYAGRGAGVDATGTLAAGAPPDAVKGPRLVLVHGVYEGKAFALDPALAQGDRWIIGRRRGLAVSLDYDPYVSFENTAIVRSPGAFAALDLATSKNGTTVNWAPLAKGVPRPLEAGDILGVGRSMLSFLPR